MRRENLPPRTAVFFSGIGNEPRGDIDGLRRCRPVSHGAVYLERYGGRKHDHVSRARNGELTSLVHMYVGSRFLGQGIRSGG